MKVSRLEGRVALTGITLSAAGGAAAGDGHCGAAALLQGHHAGGRVAITDITLSAAG